MVKIWKLQYDELIFKDIDDPDADVRELTQEADIDIDYTYNGERKRLLLRLRKGFRCDGASVPNIASFILKPWYSDMRKNIAAIVHDAIYVFGGVNCDKVLIEFHEANELFRELLDWGDTVGEFRASIAYFAVDSFVGKKCYSTTNSYDIYNYDKITWGEL